MKKKDAVVPDNINVVHDNFNRVLIPILVVKEGG